MQRLFLWVLVPVLPILGMICGIWMIPPDTSRWQINFEKDVAVSPLGFADGGNILLLAETHFDNVNKTSGYIYSGLIGIETHTGKVSFQSKFPDSILAEPADLKLKKGVYNPRLSDDVSQILLCFTPQFRGTNTYLTLLYDWQTRQVLKRYSVGIEHGALNHPLKAGKTVAAMGINTTSNLLLWRENADQPFVLQFDTPTIMFGLSPDGEMAHVIRNSSPPQELVLVDVKRSSISQTLHGLFYGICWSKDHQRFLVLESDSKLTTSTVRQYILRDGQFVPSDLFTPLSFTSSLGINASLNHPRSTISYYSQLDPWRVKLLGMFGMKIRPLLDRIWPEGYVVQLHDSETGNLLHRVVLPNEWSGSTIIPHPTVNAMALCTEQRVAFWDIYSHARWYPLVGLLLGVFLSTYLAYRKLRRPGAPKIYENSRATEVTVLSLLRVGQTTGVSLSGTCLRDVFLPLTSLAMQSSS